MPTIAYDLTITDTVVEDFFEIENVFFSGKLKLVNVEVSGRFYISKSGFLVSPVFSGLRVSDGISVTATIFFEGLEFDRSTIKWLELKDSILTGRFAIDSSTNMDGIWFEGTRFGGAVSLNGMKFEYIYLARSTFQSDLSIRDVIVRSNGKDKVDGLSLYGSKIDGTLDLSGSLVVGPLSISKSIFDKAVRTNFRNQEK